MRFDLKKAAKEVLLAASAGTAFLLFSAALFAVAVRAYDPPQGVVTGVSFSLRLVAAFAFSMLFVKGEYALFKGLAAGACFCLLALFLFAAIAGGFRLTWLFPLELLACAAFGVLGALCGGKLRKER